MTDSKNIEYAGDYQIEGTVRITPDAKVLTLNRDDKGMQHSRVIQPQARKFGFFVDLPVKTPSGKSKLLPFELKEIYQQAFPGATLPDVLILKNNDKPHPATPLRAEQQQKLFD